MRQPREPTPQERAAHEAVHLPFAAWCAICVAAKGKDVPHLQIHHFPEIALLEFDYCFVVSSLEGDHTQTYLLGVHVQSGSGFARLILSKGPTDITVVPALIAWLESIGLTTEITCRTDGEPSLVALVREFAQQRRAKTILETTPVRSSSSIGVLDQLAQKMTAQVRALRLDLQKRFSIWLPVTHLSFGWLLRHCCFLLDRYQPSRSRNNKTPFEIIHGKVFDREVAAFGSIGMGRNPNALALLKAEPRWFLCAWMG